MITLTTLGVRISIEAQFQPEYSSPMNGEYMFAYKVTIENHSEHTVRLLKRHWNIFDSVGEFREVDGIGVVGKQPVLRPMEVHQYVSGCNLRSEIGRMYGDYLMERVDDGKQFRAMIPQFELIAPLKLN